MGVIQRQGTKNSIVGLIGVMVGAFATLFIYPNALEAYGLARFLIDTSAILAPILIMGIHSLPVKFHPQVKTDDGKDHGFLSFLIAIGIITILIVASIFYWQQEFIIHKLLMVSKDEILQTRNSKFLLSLGILGAISLFFTQYITVFERITIPAVFNNLFPKVGVALLILLVSQEILRTEQIGMGIFYIYVLIAIGLILYLRHLGRLRFGKIELSYFSSLRKEFIDYALFSVLGGVGYLIAFRIDSIMVTTLVGNSDNGAYNIGLFIGSAISIPVTAITSISAPLIANWWKTDDRIQISDLYKKSSINLLLIGIGLFVLIITSLKDLLEMLPQKKEFTSLYDIVLFLGLARIVDMSLGVKHQIILYSNHYKFALYTVLTLAISNVFFNLFFIGHMNWGMRGAAIATCLSFILINIIYYIFIKTKFSMQPFTLKTIILLVLGIILIAFGKLLWFSSSPLINLSCKSIVMGSIYVFCIYHLKVSPHFNSRLSSFLKNANLK